MYEILLIVYLLVAVLLIIMILIQQGKGADMGASFGAGSSNTLFGASGSGNFMTKTTTALAALFFVISIILGNLTANQVKQVDEFSDLSIGTEQSQPSAEVASKGDAPVSDIPVTAEDSDNLPAEAVTNEQTEDAVDKVVEEQDNGTNK